MAWVAGADVTTGDLITAATWNNYLGATGSLEYLKTQTDRLDNISHAEPARAIGTIYQNTTGKIIIVTVTLQITNADVVAAYTDSGTPPTTIVGQAAITGDDVAYVPITFVVLNGDYYEVDETSGTATLIDWHEWTL